jgi:hypothetical protein
MHFVSKSKLVAGQKAELTIELGRAGLFAKRFTASLRGFDLYTESLEAGASRNHFKLSVHASGSAHHTVGRLRSPENRASSQRHYCPSCDKPALARRARGWVDLEEPADG